MLHRRLEIKDRSHPNWSVHLCKNKIDMRKPKMTSALSAAHFTRYASETVETMALKDL